MKLKRFTIKLTASSEKIYDVLYKPGHVDAKGYKAQKEPRNGNVQIGGKCRGKFHFLLPEPYMFDKNRDDVKIYSQGEQHHQ
jgi:hypothetical protein